MTESKEILNIKMSSTSYLPKEFRNTLERESLKLSSATSARHFYQ